MCEVEPLFMHQVHETLAPLAGSRIVEVLPEMLFFVASALEDGMPATQQPCRYFFKYTRCSGIHRIVAPFEHQPHLLVLKLSL
jgi:hypothetical protein